MRPARRASSAVQAVAVFYPVTALLNLGPSAGNLGDGGPGLPPILIYHGGAGTLAPLEVKLAVHPGGRHGWPTMLFDEREFVRWFDRRLKPAGR